MKIKILCLDDYLQTLNEPLIAIFGTLCKKGTIPDLKGGLSTPFEISGFGETTLSIEIFSNTENDPVKVCNEIDNLSQTDIFDIVLIDDDWKNFGNTEGQSRLLPKVISSIKGVSPELPILVLFTQHWEQADRVRALCDLMNRFQDEQRRITGLLKSDFSGLMLQIQRVVSEKKVVEERARLTEENKRLRLQVGPLPENIIGSSPKMLHVYGAINSVAPTKAPVLITGESGTGKELVAKAIHDRSPRKNQPYIAVNIAAIPADLLESELFGHERGAFTGADREIKGKFELATTGTILLDEIGEMPLELQVKLLRVIQEQVIDKLGKEQPIHIDVRIISATNCNIEELVNQGKFRQDLYYRLAVIPIQMPPLRERGDDLPALVDYLLKVKSGALGKNVLSISDGAMKRLMSYSWPGNVRELSNVIERAVLLCGSSSILPEHVHIMKQERAPAADNASLVPMFININKDLAGKALIYLEECEEIARSGSDVTQDQLAIRWGCSRSNVTQRIRLVKKEMKLILNHPPNSGRWPKARASGCFEEWSILP